MDKDIKLVVYSVFFTIWGILTGVFIQKFYLYEDKTPYSQIDIEIAKLEGKIECLDQIRKELK